MKIENLEGMVSRTSAAALAVTYAGFLAAVRRRDYREMTVQGRMLKRDQELTRIELLTPAGIDELVATIRRAA